MSSVEVIRKLEEGRIIAILRGDFEGREEEIVSALVDGGITAVEVTLNSPDALNTIGRLARRFGSRIAVGAGTVLTAGEVVRSAGAGARFIVSPNRDTRVIAETKRLGMVSLPGCFTPSEIVEAVDAGADAIKIFPADTLGPAYIRAVRAPLGDIRLVPTGGVTPVFRRRRLGGRCRLGIAAAGSVERRRSRTAATACGTVPRAIATGSRDIKACQP